MPEVVSLEIHALGELAGLLNPLALFNDDRCVDVAVLALRFADDLDDLIH